MEPGTRVRLLSDVDRYPHFVAPAGSTGEVVEYSNDSIRVRLDDDLEGAEEWGNEIQWYQGMFEEEDFEAAFRNEVEVIEGG